MNFISSLIYRRIAHRPQLIKIFHNFGWLFFDKIIKMGVGFFITLWIARYLGPEQYGLLSFGIAFVGLFGIFTTLGLNKIVVRDIVRNPDCAPEILGTAAVLQFISSMLFYLLILVAINYIRPEDIIFHTIVSILGSMILFKASDISLYWFESKVLSKYIVWAQGGVLLVFAVVKVVLILQQASLIDFVWTILAEAVFSAIFILGFMNKYGPSLAKLRVSLKRSKSLLKDSWPLLISGISVMIYMRIDQIMIGLMISDEAVGIYSSSLQISEMWYFVPIIVVASVFPAILDTKKRSEEQYYVRLQKLYDLLAMVSVGIALPITFLATPIVTLLLGESYYSAGTILSIHIWGAVFVFLGVAGNGWFLAEELQILSMLRTGTGAIVNVVLNLWLIPVYGIEGAAVATVISYSIAGLFADAIYKNTRRTFFMKVSALNPLAVYKRYV